MPTLTADNFLDLLERSGLIEKDRLQKVFADFERLHGKPVTAAEPGAIADKLVQAGLITSWHRDRLLEGKYKGFYLVGKYKLLGHLGTGGMSSVYLAEHQLMQRLVAIKTLPRSRVNDSSYLARFRREAQAAAKLDHINIVRAYDIDNQDDMHFLVMEYVEGRDLQSLVHEVGQLDFDVAADYIRQAAEGLEHAHQAGLIHRDIKPANLLLDNKGTVKVLDMGLARWEHDDQAASLTIAHEENVLGTADYLAPEQAKDSHSVDKRADIYGLGCTLYFLLTGHATFPTGTLAQRILAHQKDMPKSVYEDRPDAPPPLVDVCLRMMAKQPDARYQSAGEVAQVLAKWLQSRGKNVSGGSSIAKAKGPVGPPPRRSSAPSQIGSAPARPPRRGEKSGVPEDDTVSNRTRETMKGRPPSSIPAHGGSNVLGTSERSALGKPPATVSGKSGGSILGGSGLTLGKSSVKGLPVAKPLSQAGASAAKGSPSPPVDDSLPALLDQAIREIQENPVAAPKRLLEEASSHHQRAESPAPWFWYAIIGGGLLFVIVMVVLALLLL